MKSIAWHAVAVAGLLFGFYSVARERLVPFNADPGRAAWRLTGDEPAYLLTAQAIASGDGENVRHVHERRTYTNYQTRIVIGDNQWTWQNYEGLGVSHLTDRAHSWGDKQVIQRPPLIALFAAPFALQRSHVRWSVAFAQGIMASVVAALLLVAAGATAGSSLVRKAFASVAFLGGMPVLYYTAQIFPEVLMGSFLALSLMLARKERPAYRWPSYALMLACLWGSARVALGVAAVSLLYLWRDLRKRDFVGVGILSLGWMFYAGYNVWLWGHVIPPNPNPSSPLDISLVPKGLLIALFGNDVGLLFLSPVTWLGVVCTILISLFHGGDRGTWPTLLLLAGISGVVGAFPDYRAGTCPAGRYQVVQTFVLLVPVLIFLCKEPPDSIWLRRVSTTLLVLGLATLGMGIVVAQHPSSWFERYHPLFRRPSIQPYYYLLPDFKSRWVGRLAAWMLLFIASTFLCDGLDWCSNTRAFTTLRGWVHRLRAVPER